VIFIILEDNQIQLRKIWHLTKVGSLYWRSINVHNHTIWLIWTL